MLFNVSTIGWYFDRAMDAMDKGAVSIVYSHLQGTHEKSFLQVADFALFQKSELHLHVHHGER